MQDTVAQTDMPQKSYHAGSGYIQVFRCTVGDNVGSNAHDNGILNLARICPDGGRRSIGGRKPKGAPPELVGRVNSRIRFDQIIKIDRVEIDRSINADGREIGLTIKSVQVSGTALDPRRAWRGIVLVGPV